MTQIQAYESMSKEALIEHHKHTLQQHADDMDMLSKELASKSLTVPHGYRLVRLSDIDTAIQRASVFDDGGDGADPESARSCIAILRSMLKTERTATSPDLYIELMADQAELINIERLQRWLTKYGISTPESLEELGARRGHYVNALTRQEPFAPAAPAALRYAAKVIELYDDATMRADYMLSSTDCAEILEALAEYFTEHPRSSVDKTPETQAFQVDEATKKPDTTTIYVASVPLSACTCPSGDGSLRWPCPVHPPESEQKVQP